MGHRDYVADLPQPSDLQDLMMRLSFKAGLFVRLLAVCILVAFICGALVTVAFHSYRSTLTQNRLGAELTAQADALAPLAAETLAAGDLEATQQILQSYTGLQYVTCVDLIRGGFKQASWPDGGCDASGLPGDDRLVAAHVGGELPLIFRTRVHEELLLAPVRNETILVAAFMLLLSLIIFLVLALSFRGMVLAPLEGLRRAMQESTPRNPVRAKLIQDDEIGAIVRVYNSLVAAARLFVRRLDRSQVQLAESEKRFRELAEVSGDWFFEMDAELRLSFLSDNFFKVTGLQPDDVIGRARQDIAVQTGSQTQFADHLADLEARREFRRFEYELRGVDGKPVHVSISGVPVIDDSGEFQGYRGIGIDISEIKEKERQLAETNRNFGDSVAYASSIQRGILPTQEQLDRHLGKAHVIWQPKDLVGGDFYAVKTIGHVDYLVFFDCTGHGVPGAFMTLIVTSVLDQIAVSAPAAIPAARVLQLLHDGVCRQLGITADNPGHDGLDCAVVRLNRSEDSLEFAAASIDLFEIAADGVVTRHRGGRLTLGYRVHDGPLQIPSVSLRIGESAFVMTTDGILTQIGEATKRVMGTRRFQEALGEIGGNQTAKIIRASGRVLKNWQGREERRDDVSVIAFKPNDFS